MQCKKRKGDTPAEAQVGYWDRNVPNKWEHTR